jgi:hypothetical protein
MVPRLAAGALLLTIVAAIAACQSSARYGTPASTAIATGAAVAGAAAVRAAGGCWAECVAGTHCNHASGLCVREPTPAISATTKHPTGSRPPPQVSSVSYAPGHEYEVPASMSVADAGCELGHGERDGGPLVCEMDAATSSE